MKLNLTIKKADVIITFLFASSLLIASSTEGSNMRLRRRYEMLRDENGCNLCAVGAPLQTFTRVRSRVSCSSKCAQLSNCERFNFKKKKNICEIFVTNPTSFSNATNCEHYQFSVSVRLGVRNRFDLLSHN